MAARQLCWPPAILFYRCPLDLYSSPNLHGRVSKRCRMFDGDPDLYHSVSNLGDASPLPKFGGPKTSKFRRDFGELRDLIVNISGTQQDIVNRKTALQTTDTPAQANLIRCTFVHKQPKIGPGL